MSKGSQHDELIVSAAAVTVAANDGTPLTRIRLLPMGTFMLKDGRGPFTLRDQAHAQAVIAATQAYWGAEKMSFDYEHQVLAAKSEARDKAVASAWIRTSDLTAEADGIWANGIEWTRVAAAHIGDKEYLYFSPLFGAVKASGLVTKIFGGGLTNDPAIGGLTVVAASRFHHHKESEMDIAALAAALGLVATATEAEVIAAASSQGQQLADLRKAVGAKDGDTAEAVIAAASALRTAKTAGADDVIVPASVWADTQTRLGALEGDKVTALVDEGIAEGKIVPASREQMLSWAKTDRATFEAFLKTAPVVVAAGAALRGRPAPTDGGLTAEERVAAASAGLTDDEFKAEKALNAKGA